jgi:phage shock protein PspC (stress-responsive transcriptional regulator)
MSLTTPNALNSGVPENLPVLSRPREGAVFAGVCAGVARRLGVSVAAVRVFAVVATIIFAGLGAALYAAGLLLMPREGEQFGPLPKAVPALRRWPIGWLAALVVLIIVVAAWATGIGPALVPAAIIGLILWVVVFRPRQAAHTTQVEPTPFERAADAWRVRLAEKQVPGFEQAPVEPRWQQPYTDPSDRWVSDGQPLLPAVATPRRPRNWRLWGVTLALAGTFTAAVALANIVFGLPAGPLAYLGAVLAALGITGLLAARYGRPPLFAAATIVAMVLAATQFLPHPGSVGEVTRSITNEADLPATVTLGAGSVDLNLNDLQLTSSRTLTIDIGAGEVVVNLPDHLRTQVEWQVGAGEATVAGRDIDGLNLADSLNLTPSGAPDQPVLTLNIRVGTGNVEVKP